MRLDSGNLVELAPAVRAILDEAGLGDAKIMATGDLNEYKIHELVAAGAPIDVFGVGTELATSADAPVARAWFTRWCEMEQRRIGTGATRCKLSDDKATLPGAKQVFRYARSRLAGARSECPACPNGGAAGWTSGDPKRCCVR